MSSGPGQDIGLNKRRELLQGRPKWHWPSDNPMPKEFPDTRSDPTVTNLQLQGLVPTKTLRFTAVSDKFKHTIQNFVDKKKGRSGHGTYHRKKGERKKDGAFFWNMVVL